MKIETLNKIENNIQKSVLKTITEIDSYSNKATNFLKMNINHITSMFCN